MSILYGRKAGKSHLFDTEDRSFRCYDKNGAFISKNGSLVNCNDWVEVDVVSILTKGVDVEVYLNGQTFKVSDTLQSCVNKLVNFGRHIGVTLFERFGVNGEYTQVVLCYQKNTVNIELIYKILVG